ncbi:thioredoxin family protein [Kaarinaea lacus]
MLRLLISGLLGTTLLLTVQPALAESAINQGDRVAIDAAQPLPVVTDLAALGEESRRAGVPILLMFSSETCAYCQRLEEDVLRPIRLSGADPKQVLVRKVMLDEYETLRLFTGEKQDADRYASSEHGVYVVPTIALLDSDGKKLVPNIQGYNTPGIYESYLDEAIKVSNLLLKQR